MHHDFIASDFNKCFWTGTDNLNAIFKAEQVHIRTWIIKSQHSIDIEGISGTWHRKSLRQNNLKSFSCSDFLFGYLNLCHKFVSSHIPRKLRRLLRRNSCDISGEGCKKFCLHPIKAREGICIRFIDAFVGTVPIDCIGNQSDCSFSVIHHRQITS